MYFPMFVELKDKKVLIIGGGNIAAEKAEKLRSFGADITVCAKSVLPELAAISDLVIEGECKESYIDGADLVICATDDRFVNAKYAACAREKGKAVNCVDDKENSDFIFPSVVLRGDVCAAVSTNGKSPLAAKYLKELISSVMPENIAYAVDVSGRLRDRVKAEYPPEERKKAFERILSLALSGLSEEEIIKELKEI